MKYKDPGNVQSFIKRLNENLYKLSYQEVQIDCNSIFKYIPTPIVDFENNPNQLGQRMGGGSNLIFRARPNENNKPFDYISQISYVQENDRHKIGYGRANKKGEAMFYGAFNYATACIEAITKGNRFENQNSVMLTVGVWKIKTPLKFVQLPYSEKHFKGFYDTVGYKSNKIKLEDVQKDSKELRTHFEHDIEYEVMQFFSDEFAKFDMEEICEYKISNYYTDRVFNRIKGFEIEEIDGITYPSIASSYQERNIVLKPEVIDAKKLEFVSAIQVWMVYNANINEMNFYPIKNNVKADFNGKLNWEIYTK